MTVYLMDDDIVDAWSERACHARVHTGSSAAQRLVRCYTSGELEKIAGRQRLSVRIRDPRRGAFLVEGYADGVSLRLVNNPDARRSDRTRIYTSPAGVFRFKSFEGYLRQLRKAHELIHKLERALRKSRRREHRATA